MPDKRAEVLKRNTRKHEDMRKSETERKDKERERCNLLFVGGEEWEEAEERR